MRFIVDVPGLQEQVRADPSLIPALIEEALRLEGSSKQTARLARRDTQIGDRQVPAGTKVLVMLSGGNLDPSRWENPAAFELKRPRIKENLAFGRGKHVCPGAPLVRAEVRLILEKFLELTPLTSSSMKPGTVFTETAPSSSSRASSSAASRTSTSS